MATYYTSVDITDSHFEIPFLISIAWSKHVKLKRFEYQIHVIWIGNCSSFSMYYTLNFVSYSLTGKTINGQWSHWGGWSDCSVTCGGGFRQRQRYCDDPAPDPDGKICAGENGQNGTCSVNTCPECPEFPSVYGVLHECNKTDGMITCTVSCRTGLAFIPQEPPLDVYECGRNTRYKWNSVPPSCTEFYSPKAIKTKRSVEYPNLPCSNKEEAKRQIIENSKSLKCLANKTCDADIQIEDCVTSEDKVRASIELKSTIAKSDLDFEGFLNTSIPNEAMKSFFNSLNDLSLSVHELNTSEEFYHLNIGGISYDADFTSAQTQVGVDCEEGHVQSTLFCADCPQGTYYFENKCEPCEFGMYQDEIAQVKCKTCPDSYTTDYRGAKLKTECDVYVEKKVVITERNPGSSDNGLEVWIPIVASVLSCVVVVVVITIWYLVKKKYIISQKKTVYKDKKEFKDEKENTNARWN